MTMFKKYLDKEFYNEWGYFVGFHDKNTNEVMHICAYKERPDVATIKNLIEELKTDSEFGMESNYVDSLKISIFKKKGE